MQVELEQLVTPTIQIGCASVDGLVRHALPAGCRSDCRHLSLTEVLVDAAGLIQAAERRLVPMDNIAALCLVEALEVDPCQTVHNADVPCLREKRAVVDETPEGDQAVEASGVFVVAEDAPNSQHGRTVMCTGMCLAGS